MDRRSAASSTGHRRACPCRRRTFRTISTNVAPDSPGLRRNAESPIRCASLSGVLDGLTTGAPIGLLIENQDARSKDYETLKDRFRPGHADYTYHLKYGIRDHRGGGRASARETAMRVAAGAIARRILGDAVTIRGALVQVGPLPIDRDKWDWSIVDENPFWCPDADAAEHWAAYLDDIRKAGSSTGAIIEVTASGVPAGLGAPVYGKLDAELAHAMMGINAVKGVEIGAGFGAAALEGIENADRMYMKGDAVAFRSNHAGGTLGGISTGQGHRRSLRRQADQFHRPSRGNRHRRRPGQRDRHQRSPRPLRRHSRRSRRRSDDGLCSCRPSIAPSRPVRELIRLKACLREPWL